MKNEYQCYLNIAHIVGALEQGNNSIELEDVKTGYSVQHCWNVPTGFKAFRRVYGTHGSVTIKNRQGKVQKSMINKYKICSSVEVCLLIDIISQSVYTASHSF